MTSALLFDQNEIKLFSDLMLQGLELRSASVCLLCCYSSKTLSLVSLSPSDKSTWLAISIQMKPNLLFDTDRFDLDESRSICGFESTKLIHGRFALIVKPLKHLSDNSLGGI